MHSVRTSRKSMDQREVFVHIQLEHRPITGEADSIKVAGGITRQRIRTASPVPARKVEEYGLIPSRTQLENRPELRSATVFRAAIKISQPIGNQPRLRATAVCPSTEAVDDAFHAAHGHLINHATTHHVRASCALHAAVQGGAVEVARAIPKQRSPGFTAVSGSVEGIEDPEFAGQ